MAFGLVLFRGFADPVVQPVAYCIVGEVSSTRLRGKTVGLARNLYNVVGIVSGILNTYMMVSTYSVDIGEAECGTEPHRMELERVRRILLGEPNRRTSGSWAVVDFVQFVSCVGVWVWTYFRLPECKGRSFRELDILFEHRISARKFKTTEVSLESTQGQA